MRIRPVSYHFVSIEDAAVLSALKEKKIKTQMTCVEADLIQISFIILG